MKFFITVDGWYVFSKIIFTFENEIITTVTRHLSRLFIVYMNGMSRIIF